MILGFILLLLVIPVLLFVLHESEMKALKKEWDIAAAYKQYCEERTRANPAWPRIDTTYGDIGFRPRSIIDKLLKKPLIVH